MTAFHRTIAALCVVSFLATALVAPITAIASEEGHKNTAIGLGALGAGLLLTQRNKLPGALALGGAAYAYSQADRDMRARHRREAYYRRHHYHRRHRTYHN